MLRFHLYANTIPELTVDNLGDDRPDVVTRDLKHGLGHFRESLVNHTHVPLVILGVSSPVQGSLRLATLGLLLPLLIDLYKRNVTVLLRTPETFLVLLTPEGKQTAISDHDIPAFGIVEYAVVESIATSLSRR